MSEDKHWSKAVTRHGALGANNLRKFWQDYRDGKVQLSPNHGRRGKDKPGTFRKISADNKTLSRRYYEETGRTLHKEMADQRMLIEIMITKAMDIEDPTEQQDALARAYTALANFNRDFAPYLEHKLGTLEAGGTVEDKISLDDALEGDYTDETDRSGEDS